MKKTLKILLVDDDEAIRKMYAEIFHKEGFVVFEAENGVDGLDGATKNTPDVIFTGIVMPTMDGFTMMEALKKNVMTSNIPVVISSHLGREEDQQRARDLGAKAFFIRGFYTPYEIVEKVRAIFELPEYKIKFAINELDVAKMARDLRINMDFKCPKCEGDMVLAMKLVDAKNQEFSAKLVCAGCGSGRG
ncbi:MAG: response regulator [Candidatus Moranbacteria bacterium]|nr:response regulator [Candidatus Moranbacteria bacterium]